MVCELPGVAALLDFIFLFFLWHVLYQFAMCSSGTMSI